MAPRKSPQPQAEATMPANGGDGAAGSAALAVVPRSEAWIETQSELLDRIDAMAKSWVQRRRDALDAARQSIAELHDSRDPKDLLRIQQEWLAGSLQRVTSDFESLARIALDFSQRPIRLLVDASMAARFSPGRDVEGQP